MNQFCIDFVFYRVKALSAKNHNIKLSLEASDPRAKRFKPKWKKKDGYKTGFEKHLGFLQIGIPNTVTYLNKWNFEMFKEIVVTHTSKYSGVLYPSPWSLGDYWLRIPHITKLIQKAPLLMERTDYKYYFED